MDEVVLPLDQASFREAPVVLLEAGAISVTAFRYASGIAALRIQNAVGHLVVLPFRGQQIWDAHFHGRRLTMQTAFEHPVDTTDYLAGNGAYFIHCGGSAMGNPGPEDEHPLHGELPAARSTGLGSRWGMPDSVSTGRSPIASGSVRGSRRT